MRLGDSFRYQFLLFLIVSLLLLETGCQSKSTGPDQTNRTARAGFTYFPYDGGQTGLQFALDVIRYDADLIVSHFDNGIPWDAALANDFTQYPQDMQNEITSIASTRPSGHAYYVAVTPIAFLRNGLALTRGANGQQISQAPWNGYRFDHPDVIRAFTNHCRIMINRSSPDYFAFGIEVNLLHELGGDSLWNSYLILARAVHDSLKHSNPSLPIFLTIQAESYYRTGTLGVQSIMQILPLTDMIAVSTYPYTQTFRYGDQSTANPAILPTDYFSALAGLAPGKPFAIAETVWPAEDITAPYPITVHASPDNQRAYVDILFQAADNLNAKFVSWFIPRDYDQFWASTLKNDPNAALIRVWKDTGFYDSTGTARPGLTSWRAYLQRTMTP